MKVILCPNCNKITSLYLDEWGRTPFHVHCDFCGINIGATSVKKCYELLKQYHKYETQIEYYNKKIQFLSEEGRIIKNEK